MGIYRNILQRQDFHRQTSDIAGSDDHYTGEAGVKIRTSHRSQKEKKEEEKEEVDEEEDEEGAEAAAGNGGVEGEQRRGSTSGKEPGASRKARSTF